MPSAVSPHAILIAVIFVAYFGLMISLGAYIASQVRSHDGSGSDDEDAEPALA